MQRKKLIIKAFLDKHNRITMCMCWVISWLWKIFIERIIYIYDKKKPTRLYSFQVILDCIIFNFNKEILNDYNLKRKAFLIFRISDSYQSNFFVFQFRVFNSKVEQRNCNWQISTSKWNFLTRSEVFILYFRISVLKVEK